MGFSKLQDIISISEKKNIDFWQVILQDDMNERAVTAEESFDKMREMYRQMKESDASYDKSLISPSGLSGSDGEKLEIFSLGERLVGDFLSQVIARAVKMGESNACMRRIVTAPTAGSCGVLPAVLITYEKQRGADEDEIVKSLFVAAGIGEVIATSASISGAQGGCQAEIGSAAAMAAGALTFLLGGGNKEIANSAALAIKNMLGLTCDPVAGLVEVPCVKRNAYGAVNAVVSAHLTGAGVYSKIPPDEVVDSMRRTGKLIPACLRETSQEGLATTPTGTKIAQKMKSNNI